MPEDNTAAKPKFEKPKSGSRLSKSLKLALPIMVVIGGLIAAWFFYPPLGTSLRGLLADKPEPTPMIEVIPAEDETAEETAMGAEPEDDEARQSRDQDRFRDVNLLRLALADAYNQDGAYPEALEGLMPRHINAVPRDPDPLGRYDYSLTSGGYALEFILEGPIMELEEGKHWLTPNGIDAETIGVEDEEPTKEKSDEGGPAMEEGDAADNPLDDQPASAPPISASLPPEEEAKIDTDGDGLSDEREAQLGTDSAKADTDGDGWNDGQEISMYGTNPLLADTDGDGYTDSEELEAGFDPRTAGVALNDSDGDGLWDLIEIGSQLNPNDPDSDSDGLADGDESNVYGTDPLKADSDGDGFSDGQELAGGFNPLGEEEISAAIRKSWEGLAGKYGLHPPTITTLESSRQ